MRARRLASVVVLLLAGLTAGCGGDDDPPGREDDEAASEAEREEEEENEAVDQSVCRADAEEIPAPYADGFPAEWTFPPETTVYDVEDRADTGIILTAVSSTPFEDVLAYLNGPEVDAGFEITDGETEEDDAEANWSREGVMGRWTIRKSGTCDGETVIQVFAATS